MSTVIYSKTNWLWSKVVRSIMQASIKGPNHGLWQASWCKKAPLQAKVPDDRVSCLQAKNKCGVASPFLQTPIVPITVIEKAKLLWGRQFRSLFKGSLWGRFTHRTPVIVQRETSISRWPPAIRDYLNRFRKVKSSLAKVKLVLALFKEV